MGKPLFMTYAHMAMCSDSVKRIERI